MFVLRKEFPIAGGYKISSNMLCGDEGNGSKKIARIKNSRRCSIDRHESRRGEERYQVALKNYLKTDYSSISVVRTLHTTLRSRFPPIATTCTQTLGISLPALNLLHPGDCFKRLGRFHFQINSIVKKSFHCASSRP